MRAVAAAQPAALLAAVALAGCGGSGSTETTTVTVPATQAGQTSTAADAPESVEAALQRVIRDVSPSVVLIETAEGLGSGVVYDSDGNIVTNAHVVGSAKRFTVTLSGGDRHEASLVGTDRLDDLAVIRLESGNPRPATFADSSKLAVGQITLAIGNPLGLRSSVTDGIISSLGRTVSEGNGVVITAAIQTSASINPGNSGGALANLRSEVIGIPTLAAADPQMGGQAPGIGFAVPSSTVQRIVPQLISSGRVTKSGHAYLGIEVATGIDQPGVLVASVVPGGPADGAGLQRGDLIREIDGTPIHSADELVTLLAGRKPGDKVRLDVRRTDGSAATLDVTLGENPG